jgi:hypothetical protein
VKTGDSLFGGGVGRPDLSVGDRALDVRAIAPGRRDGHGCRVVRDANP